MMDVKDLTVPQIKKYFESEYHPGESVWIVTREILNGGELKVSYKHLPLEDIRNIGADVLRHRIILSYEAEAEELTSEDVIQRLFEVVEVP